MQISPLEVGIAAEYQFSQMKAISINQSILIDIVNGFSTVYKTVRLYNHPREINSRWTHGVYTNRSISIGANMIGAGQPFRKGVVLISIIDWCQLDGLLRTGAISITIIDFRADYRSPLTARGVNRIWISIVTVGDHVDLPIDIDRYR